MGRRRINGESRMSVRWSSAAISQSAAPEVDSCEEKRQRETAEQMACSARLGDGGNIGGERRTASG